MNARKEMMVSFIMYEYVWMGGCVLSTNFDENGRYFHFYDAASGKWIIKGESRSLALARVGVVKI